MCRISTYSSQFTPPIYLKIINSLTINLSLSSQLRFKISQCLNYSRLKIS